MSPEFWASWLVEPVPWWRGLQVNEAVLLFDLRAFLKFGKAGKGKRKERGIRLELIHGDWLPISYLSIPPSCLKIISLLRRIPIYYTKNIRGFGNHVTIRCQVFSLPFQFQMEKPRERGCVSTPKIASSVYKLLNLTRSLEWHTHFYMHVSVRFVRAKG